MACRWVINAARHDLEAAPLCSPPRVPVALPDKLNFTDVWRRHAPLPQGACRSLTSRRTSNFLGCLKMAQEILENRDGAFD